MTETLGLKVKELEMKLVQNWAEKLWVLKLELQVKLATCLGYYLGCMRL